MSTPKKITQEDAREMLAALKEAAGAMELLTAAVTRRDDHSHMPPALVAGSRAIASAAYVIAKVEGRWSRDVLDEIRRGDYAPKEGS